MTTMKGLITGVKAKLPAGPTAKPTRLHTDRMNKWEAAFAWELECQQKAGCKLVYWFQSIKVRLADRTWYTPDFAIFWDDGSVEFVEIKGFLRDDAAVKFKVAREQYSQFRWRMIRKRKAGWEEVL